MTKRTVRSLLYTPPSDINFRMALASASIAEIEEALAAIPEGTPGHSKRIKILRSRLRRLYKKDAK